MKRIFVAFLLSVFSLVSFASHIVGGEMIYEYIGPGSQLHTTTYRLTLKLFRDQNTTGAAMPGSVFIGLFNNDDNSQFPSQNQPYVINKTREDPVSVNQYPPCVTNVPQLDYHVGYYSFIIELPDNNSGYTAAYQTCCRVNPLENVFNSNGVGGTGATYSCVIPRIVDSSPEFVSSIDLLCAGREFVLDFSSKDPDGDSLVYSFAAASNGGSATNANNVNPEPPPYGAVRYLSNFTSASPLGDQVTIDRQTGHVQGIAPAEGKYVVCVSVASYKNGQLTGTHTKDFIVNVGDCDFAGAQLEPKPVTCDGFSVTFSNANGSFLNKTFFWDFGDPASGDSNFSTLPNPTHVFSDTGVYVYKLVVNRGDPCSDSSTQVVKVYPGFFPGFVSTGQCKNTPVLFRDTTKSRYGNVDSWSWDFGDSESPGDTSHLKNPPYSFGQSADYQVRLIVASSKGCIDTVTTTVTIKDKLDLTVTNDTLICSIDTLRLTALGTGTFFWTPNYNINDQSSASPLVSPDVPTKYYVDVSDPFGCKGNDSVFVDVKKFVTLSAGNDTAICRSDAIVLSPVTDALYYKWSPAGTLSSDVIKNPVATPLTNTTYFLKGSIGKCEATDAVNVKVTPYPLANAGKDSAICLGASLQLTASGGSAYAWSPPFFLNDPAISNPVANPLNDIVYVVAVSDTLGCPKTVLDSVQITVLKVVADAGPSDTSIVVNQPLQLTATGGEFYLWSPPFGLTNPDVYNPVAHLSNSQTYVLKATIAGCFDTDTINIVVYKVTPDLYVPNAFTPGSDGKNDVFRPIAIGMKSLSYFRVYNRWGVLMFSTNQNGKGWDGTYEGRPQDSAVYVWIAEGIDYLGKKITKKGSVVLIR